MYLDRLSVMQYIKDTYAAATSVIRMTLQCNSTWCDSTHCNSMCYVMMWLNNVKDWYWCFTVWYTFRLTKLGIPEVKINKKKHAYEKLCAKHLENIFTTSGEAKPMAKGARAVADASTVTCHRFRRVMRLVVLPVYCKLCLTCQSSHLSCKTQYCKT